MNASQSWLSPHLRRAIMFPPLLAVPALALALIALDGTARPIPAALWVGITGAAYIAQFTYGVLCYLVLKHLRWLTLSGIVIASQLPFLAGAFVYDLPTVVAYAISALAVALASAYFLVRRPGSPAR